MPAAARVSHVCRPTTGHTSDRSTTPPGARPQRSWATPSSLIARHRAAQSDEQNPIIEAAQTTRRTTKVPPRCLCSTEGLPRLKGKVDHLAQLASGGVVVGAEVWPVGRGYAWLSCSSAWVAVDDAPRCYSLGIRVEGAARHYVLEALPCGCVVIACCVGDNLGYLSPCDVVVGPEVGTVARI